MTVADGLRRLGCQIHCEFSRPAVPHGVTQSLLGYRKRVQRQLLLLRLLSLRPSGTNADFPFGLENGKTIRLVMGGIALPNEASVALHEKFGFQKVAHFKEVGRKFEKWIELGIGSWLSNQGLTVNSVGQHTGSRANSSRARRFPRITWVSIYA